MDVRAAPARFAGLLPHLARISHQLSAAASE
jgi:hypothetical protein